MINYLEKAGTEVVQLLDASGHVDAARDMEGLLNKLLLANSDDAASLVKAITDRCHPKWLGDLNVQLVRWEEWNRMLADLSRRAKTLLK